MASLAGVKQRLERLEKQHERGGMPEFVVLRFFEVPLPNPEPEIEAVQCRGQRFIRQPGEPIEAFTTRIMESLPRIEGHGFLLFDEGTHRDFDHYNHQRGYS